MNGMIASGTAPNWTDKGTAQMEFSFFNLLFFQHLGMA
jgi:hypothetical protein